MGEEVVAAASVIEAAVAAAVVASVIGAVAVVAEVALVTVVSIPTCSWHVQFYPLPRYDYANTRQAAADVVPLVVAEVTVEAAAVEVRLAAPGVARRWSW